MPMTWTAYAGDMKRFAAVVVVVVGPVLPFAVMAVATEAPLVRGRRQVSRHRLYLAVVGLGRNRRLTLSAAFVGERASKGPPFSAFAGAFECCGRVAVAAAALAFAAVVGIAVAVAGAVGLVIAPFVEAMATMRGVRIPDREAMRVSGVSANGTSA